MSYFKHNFTVGCEVICNHPDYSVIKINERATVVGIEDRVDNPPLLRLKGHGVIQFAGSNFTVATEPAEPVFTYLLFDDFTWSAITYFTSTESEIENVVVKYLKENQHLSATGNELFKFHSSVQIVHEPQIKLVR